MKNFFLGFSPWHNEQWLKNIGHYSLRYLVPVSILLLSVWIGWTFWISSRPSANKSIVAQIDLSTTYGTRDWRNAHNDSLADGWQADEDGLLFWPAAAPISEEETVEEEFAADFDDGEVIVAEATEEANEEIAPEAPAQAQAFQRIKQKPKFDATKWRCPAKITTLREAQTVAAALDYLRYPIPGGWQACTSSDWAPLWAAIDSFVVDQRFDTAADWCTVAADLQAAYRTKAGASSPNAGPLPCDGLDTLPLASDSLPVLLDTLTTPATSARTPQSAKNAKANLIATYPFLSISGDSIFLDGFMIGFTDQSSQEMKDLLEDLAGIAEWQKGKIMTLRDSLAVVQILNELALSGLTYAGAENQALLDSVETLTSTIGELQWRNQPARELFVPSRASKWLLGARFGGQYTEAELVRLRGISGDFRLLRRVSAGSFVGLSAGLYNEPFIQYRLVENGRDKSAFTVPFVALRGQTYFPNAMGYVEAGVARNPTTERGRFHVKAGGEIHLPKFNEFALSGYALARFSEFWQGSLTASMPIGRSAFRLGLEGQYTANSATNGVWLAGLNGRLPIVLDNGRVTMGGKFLYGGDNRFLVETGIAYQLESRKLFFGK